MRRRVRSLLAMALSMTAVRAPCAHAQPTAPPGARVVELTPYAGYRIGGQTNAEDGALDFEDAASVGASLEYVARPGGRVGLLYSRQATHVTVRPFSVGEPESTLGMTIQWVQLTGSTDVGGTGAVRPYVVASLGGSYLDPGPSEAESDWNAAGTVGAGLRGALADRLRARLEARLLGTFIDASSRVFCSLPGACAVSVNGELLTQFDVSLGLSVAF